jgi:hypothetical protein
LISSINKAMLDVLPGLENHKLFAALKDFLALLCTVGPDLGGFFRDKVLFSRFLQLESLDKVSVGGMTRS